MTIFKQICNSFTGIQEGITMNIKYLSILLIIVFKASTMDAQVTLRKIDTTMKVGKTGYRVTCANKKPDKNIVSITPLGFSKDVQSFSMEIKGTVLSAETDDINQDGLTDLVIYLLASDLMHRANLIAVINENNESIIPAILPDILDDAKLRIGYKGNDTLYLMEGTLVRRFPVIQPDSTNISTTGTLMRVIQYRVAKAEGGRYKFNTLRTYQYTKQ